MPDKVTLDRAERDARQGKSASTQAGEFVREQIHHIRQGKYGARSARQVIAIGLSEARRAGINLRPSGSLSAGARRKARHDLQKGRDGTRPSRVRAKARIRVLRREGSAAASTRALSAAARSGARRRGPASRSASALRAARTRSGQ